MKSFKEHYDLSSLELDLLNQKAYYNNSLIGNLIVYEDQNSTLKDVLKVFPSKKVSSYLSQLKTPPKFAYVWIDLIKVFPKQRGKGFGTAIIKKLLSLYPKGSLIALNAGESSTGSSKSSLKDLEKFYKKIGRAHV